MNFGLECNRHVGCMLVRLVACTILVCRRTWNVNVLISFRCSCSMKRTSTNDLRFKIQLSLRESISISYTLPLNCLNHVVVVSFFPNLPTCPSTKMDRVVRRLGRSNVSSLEVRAVRRSAEFKAGGKESEQNQSKTQARKLEPL